MISKFKFIMRFLMLYLCVLIPVISFSLLMVRFNFRQAEQREERIMQKVLNDVAVELDNLYEEFQNQATVLGERNEIAPNAVLENLMGEYNLVNLLKFSRAFNVNIREVILYYGTNNIYSSQGLSSIPVYFGTTLQCTEKSIEEGIALLSAEMHNVKLLRSHNKHAMLMFHYPLEDYSLAKYKASVNFLININTIAALFEPYIIDNQVVMKLEIEDEEVYFQVDNGKCSVLNYEEFFDLKSDHDRVLQQELSILGMRLELHFDPKISWIELKKFQNMNMILLTVGILLSVLVSFGLSSRRVGRFQSLINNSTLNKSKELKGNLFQDEFSYIQTMLEESRQESEQAEQYAQSYRHVMLRQTAVMLFHGMVSKTDVIRQMLSTCNLDFSEEYYYLCGLVIEDSEIDIREFEPFFDDNLYCDGVIDNRRMIFFMAESSATDQECRIRMEMVNQFLRKLLAAKITVSKVVLSQIYEKLTMVNYAYLEVVSLLKNSIQPDMFIECWDNHQRTSAEMLTEKQADLLECFIQALEERSFYKAEKALNCLFDERQSTDNRYYLRYYVRQALILAVRNEDSVQNVALMSRIVRIDPAMEIRFSEMVVKVLEDYCSSNLQSEKLKIIVEYVEQNYQRYDLSKEEVAIHAEINKTQMSKLLKEKLGMGYMDFLTKLRMEKAKDLLLNTDQPVKHILQLVGYIDQTSFTKKFKAYYGMSPAEYRSHGDGV